MALQGLPLACNLFNYAKEINEILDAVVNTCCFALLKLICGEYIFDQTTDHQGIHRELNWPLELRNNTSNIKIVIISKLKEITHKHVNFIAY